MSHCQRSVSPTALAALCALALMGCASSPSATALEQADYGPAPAGFERDIAAAFSDLLIDPDSARFEYAPPEQGWGRTESDTDYVFGWCVMTRVNSKNQFGAFTGWRDYKVLLVDNDVHSIYSSTGNDLLGNPRYARLQWAKP